MIVTDSEAWRLWKDGKEKTLKLVSPWRSLSNKRKNL